MSLEPKKKQYGLILSKKKEDPVRLVRNVFEDDDESIDKVDVSNEIQSASTMRVKKEAERIHELALAEDPSIFDYDASYEEIQATKNEKVMEQKKADKERKSKYALDIIKSYKRREIERQSREERQQQKEREQEGEEFADKEVFVTGAYRQQMEEVQKFRQEEAYEAKFNELTSVEKQKAWQAGFGRTLLSEIARGVPSLMKKGSMETENSETKVDKQLKKRERHTRQRLNSRSPSPLSKSKESDKPVKSIYSDDENDTGPQFSPPKKNFEGELKPGLNRVIKAQTKSEKLKERLFTPTPPSSDDEKKDGRRTDGKDKERRREKRVNNRERKPEFKDGGQRKEYKLKESETKNSDESRLLRLKDILKQRNGVKEIEEFRQRYFERKESGILVPPL